MDFTDLHFWYFCTGEDVSDEVSTAHTSLNFGTAMVRIVYEPHLFVCVQEDAGEREMWDLAEEYDSVCGEQMCN